MCKLPKIRADTDTGDLLTNPCHKKERSSYVTCVLCGGTHRANYKGCTVYKDLQKKTYPPLSSKIYTTSAQIKQTLCTQPGVSYARVTKQKFHVPTNIEQEAHIKQSHQQTICMQELKNM
jgi:hypothetical protein